MKIIDDILQSRHFISKPPILIDIGASGEINPKWNRISKHSICVAFDADDREFQIDEGTNTPFKKLLKVNRILTAESIENPAFYLTASPYCSSLLEPDLEKLTPWIFKPLFELSSKITLPAITLQKSIHDIGIDYIDWFKTDTQGTDLRLFKSLPEQIKESILAAEFEPGIMDAYKNEDKLYMIMEEMNGRHFWLSSMKVKGTQRITRKFAEEFSTFATSRMIRKSPGWAEICYLRNPEGLNERSLLMLYVFAVLDRQFGFALEIADYGNRQFREPLFQACEKAIRKKIGAEKLKLPLIFLKRKINKLFGSIDE